MKKQTPANPIRFRRKPLITALEPRILLDGAAVATTAEMTTDVAFQDEAVHTEAADQSVHFAAPAPTGSEPGSRREVAFVDTSVEDHQSLVDGLGDNVEVMLIDGSENGLEQMVAALQGQSGIDAIHLFSHGDVGELKLGTLTLNGETLAANAELLSTLGASLSEAGDLMLYGCYVGVDSEGQSFIDSVAELTQADVAASEDLTGAASLGGDWELEAESGVIETAELAVAGFTDTLGERTTYNFSTASGSYGNPAIITATNVTLTDGGTLTIVANDVDYAQGELDRVLISYDGGSTYSALINTYGDSYLRGSNGVESTTVFTVPSFTLAPGITDLKIKIDVTVSGWLFDVRSAVLEVFSNTRPTGADRTVTLSEDTSKVLSLADFGFSDADTVRDGDQLEKVQLTDLPDDGRLLLNGSSVSLNQEISRADILAGKLVFKPDANESGSNYASLGFKVYDGYQYSSSANTLTFNVTNLNDAPSFQNGVSLSPVNEDTASPSGSTVSDLLGGVFRDVDTGDSLAGIIITADASDVAEGEWQYSTDGSNWYSVGSVASSSGLLLSSTSSLRFVPAADYNGTPGSLSVHAVDSSNGGISFTSGAARQAYDTTVGGNAGGASAVSASAVSLGTSITAVNDAPVMDAPAGGTVTDTEDRDTFDPVTGTLSASDIDSGSLSYGIQGGSDNGTYVTLTGAYGTLQITKATGAYTFSPSSAAINGLNTTETQAFTVTVSDGALSGTQVLEFALEGANDNPVFEPDNSSTQVSVFSYPNLNGTDATPGTNNENANLASIVQWVINEGGEYTLDTSIQNFTDADFADKLNASGFFFMTDMEQFTSSFDPLSNTYLPASAVDAINSWVNAGGVIMMTGTAGSEDVEFLNRVFGWDLTSQSGSSWSLNADNAAGTPFEGGPASLNEPSATDSIGAGTVAGFKAIYGTDSNATVAEIGFGAGRVLFLGYDYFSSGISGTGFTDTATQYGADVADGESNMNDWVREIIPRALEYSANLSSSTLLTGTDSALSTSGQLRVSDVDQPDSVTVSVSGVMAEQRDADGVAMASSGSQPSAAELLAMLDTGSQPSIDSSATSGDVNWTFNSNGETFSYLAAGESLVLTYELTADDGNGGTATRTLNITINGINDAPVSQDATQSVAENGVYTGAVSATDIDGTIAGFELVSDVASGSLTFKSNGSYEFDPGTDFDDLSVGETRQVSFTYKATDNNGAASSAATITLTVVGSNDAPVVSAGTGTASENGQIDSSVPVATDVDGSIASYQVVTDVSSGSLTLNNDGTYSFDPGSDFDDLAVGESRQVSFTYTATDNDGSVSAPGTVTFTITGTNDAPTITAAAAAPITEVAGDSSAQDLSDTGVVSFDDLDTTDVIDITYSSNGDVTWSGGALDMALAISLASGFTIPTATDAAAPGSVNWTYSLNSVDLDFLAAGETLTFSYTITATDGQEATTDTVSFTITGTNDAPTITATAAAPISEAVDAGAQGLSDSGEVSFADLDSNDLIDIRFAANGDIAWSGATLDEPLDADLAAALVAGFSVSATDAEAPGSVNWTYSVDNADLDFLAVGETITFSYTVTADDGNGGTATDVVSFTLTGTNDAPTVSAAAASGITEAADAGAQDLSDSGEVSFADLDSNDLIDIRFASNGDIAWSGATLDQPLDADLAAALVAGFSVSATDAAAPGSVNWTYSVDNADLDFLAVGETITFSYTVTADDGNGGTATDVVSFTLTGTNDAPMVSAAAASAITEAVDAGAQDLSDSGEVSFADLDSNDLIDIRFAANGDIAWSGATLDEPLDADLAAALVAGFSVSASDAAAPGSVNWTYSVDNADLDFLAVGETITFSYTVTADDGNGGTATDVVSFTLTGTNDAPTVSAAAASAITEAVDAGAQDLSDSGEVSFADLDSNDLIDVRFAANGDIAWSGATLDEPLDADLAAALVAGFSVSATDAEAPGSVNWNYSVDNADLDFLAVGETITFSYTVTADDGNGGTATDVVSFTLTGTNDAPEVTADDAGPFVESEAASAQDLSGSGSVNFSDKDLTDDIDISFVSNEDIRWSRQDGSEVAELPAGLVSALLDGFTVGADNQPHNGQINWTYDVSSLDLDFLNEGDQITFSYTVTAQDSEGASANTVVTVTLVGSNDAPEMTARQMTDDETIVQQGAEYAIEVASLFSDKDSTLSREDLDFTITGLPAGVSYDPLTGVISGKPTESGAFTIIVTASDAEGATLSRSYGMTVTAVVAEDGATGSGDMTPPPAPDTDSQPVKNDLSGMPDGLVGNQDASNDPADSSGFMQPSPVEPESGNDDVDLEPDQPVSEPQDGGGDGDGATEQVILSEPGALVVESKNSDGSTSVRASVDVNVNASGQVEFSQDQQNAFDTVSLAVASINNTAEGQLVIAIEDTSTTASSQLYSGGLSNGEQLPGWIQLDPITGSVTIANPPAGQKEVSIRIQAVGIDGQVRVLELKLDLEELLKRPVAGEGAEIDADTAGFVPLNDQLEAELAARDQYGDRLMAMLQSV